MKISTHLLSNVVLLLAGILLLIFNGQPDLFVWVARIVGVVFAIPSVIYLADSALHHSRHTSGLGVVPALGGLCFGVTLLAWPAMFAGVFSVLMGVVLVVLGLYHVVYLFLSRKLLRTRAWHYVLPLLVVVLGGVICAVPAVRTNASLVVILTGVSFILFNFTSMQEYFTERKARRSMQDAPAGHDDEQVSIEL